MPNLAPIETKRITVYVRNMFKFNTNWDETDYSVDRKAANITNDGCWLHLDKNNKIFFCIR